jgi:hypothetical protein
MKMNDATALYSKVLVLDDDEQIHPLIKAFCDENGLIPVKATDGNPLSVLRSNVDLGAILIWENFNQRAGRGIVIARQIHGVRPELPIFLRRDVTSGTDGMAGIDEADHRLFRASFAASNMTRLRDAIGESLFNRVYPTALVRGITEVTKAALEGQFKNLTVEHEAPCLVKDRIIYGQLFSMIPLDSSWCRGYMMLQTEEQPLLKFMSCHTFGHVTEEIDFRELNNLLGEATNMVWGAFKNRFIVEAPDGARLTQVPIIVNHQHRYISFGSEEPLLCVKYRLLDNRDPARGHIVVYQWFAFSLLWSPDKFKENLPSVDSLFASGELEMF